MSTQRYRKKPAIIETMRYDGTPASATPIINWIIANGGTARYVEAQPDSGPYKPAMPHHIAIDTLEGTMHADVGDFVIRGVLGEFYPCKPDIFEATYELVETGNAR